MGEEDDPAYDEAGGFGPMILFDTDGTQLSNAFIDDTIDSMDEIEDGFEEYLEQVEDDDRTDASIQVG